MKIIEVDHNKDGEKGIYHNNHINNYRDRIKINRDRINNNTYHNLNNHYNNSSHSNNRIDPIGINRVNSNSLINIIWLTILPSWITLMVPIVIIEIIINPKIMIHNSIRWYWLEMCVFTIREIILSTSQLKHKSVLKLTDWIGNINYSSTLFTSVVGWMNQMDQLNYWISSLMMNWTT